MDQYNLDMQEQEIDLKDLLYTIFKKWRPILLTALVLAVLAGGYRFVSDFIAAGNSTDTESAIAEYESSLTSHRLQLQASEKQLTATQRLLETETARMDTSPLMQLDPSEAIRLSYIFEVAPDRSAPFSVIQEDRTAFTQKLVNGYVAKLSDEITEEAAAKLQQDASDLSSILSIEGDEYTGRLYIDVYAATKNDAVNILNVFTDLLAEYQDAMSAEFGAHSIQQVSERLYHDANQEIMDRQIEQISGVTELKTSLTNLESSIAELSESEPQLPAVSKSAIIKSSAKYLLIGFVLGGFLAAFAVCVVYIMNDKIRALKDIAVRYGLKELGEFQPVEEKKRALSCIDHLIDRLFGHGRKINAEEMYQIIAANVNNYASEQAKDILIAGSVSQEMLDPIKTHLSDAIGRLHFETAPDFLSNHHALEKLPKCDAIILVEAKDKSTVSDLEAELSIIKNMDKPIVGIVLC